MSTASAAGLPQWRSRTTFVLALSASAIGLGNLWRFSYLSGEHGGAPFVITYVLCLFLVAAPVMIAEVVIGSQGRAAPLAAIRRACDRSLVSRVWVGLGVLASLTGILLLALYVVVAGWALAYASAMYGGEFSSLPAVEAGEYFEKLVASRARQLYWQSLFLLVLCTVIALGVRRGLGLAVWLAVPALLAILGILIRFNLDVGNLEATRAFLFSHRPVDFSPRAMLMALGHAFFSLGVGVAAGISYGAYAPGRLPIGRSVLAVAVFDAMIAILAGLAVFPIVFANNMEPTVGPGLLFVSVPYAYGNITQGEVFGPLFFLLVSLVALGSAVAITEPIVASLKQVLRVERFTAALIVTLAAWLIGLAVVESLRGDGQGFWFSRSNLFVFLDGLISGVLLPTVALLTAIFVGWRLRPEILRVELGRERPLFFSLWRFLLRYITPPAIALLMVAALWE